MKNYTSMIVSFRKGKKNENPTSIVLGGRAEGLGLLRSPAPPARAQGTSSFLSKDIKEFDFGPPMASYAFLGLPRTKREVCSFLVNLI